MHHDDGVGGMLRYESDETYDDFPDGVKKTLEFLEEVNIKYLELKSRIQKNEELINELDQIISESLK